VKKVFLLTGLLFFLGINLSAEKINRDEWTKHKAKKWFKQKEWLNGAPLTPHKAIDKVQLAQQYHLNKAAWDKAFLFLKEQNLQTISVGRHAIDGDNVFASVTEDPSKDFDKTTWESHRKYIDVQCIIRGEEKIGKCPLTKATVIKPYDENRDVANYSAKGKIYTIPAGSFIIFFPSDAHRPNITPGDNKLVKKIVVKIRVAE
jgi:biofilm protein TabA